MRAEPTAAVDTFQEELRAGLAQAGDPQRAEQARRYLKSQMPMYGVGVPQTRRLAVDLARRHPWLWEEAATWETTLRRLWDDNKHLLTIGVRVGRIITTEQQDRPGIPETEAWPDHANYVYMRHGQKCPRCSATIRMEEIAGRKLYWCPGCQK